MKIQVQSTNYTVKPLTEAELPVLYAFCRENTTYYNYMKSQPTLENLREDMTALPPGRRLEDKHFVGYWKKDRLVAVLDLIEGYPNEETAYIGWFILNRQLQGLGIGKQLIRELLAVISCSGFSFVELGYIEDNKEARAFWEGQGFFPTGREVDTESYRIVCMKKELEQPSADTLLTEPWLSWAMELQSIAQCGLTYVKDVYDAERYERLREIAAEMLCHKTELPLGTVKALFCNEVGYQTPKLDTRAAVFQDGKILLVHERDGKWSLPGGWVDVLETIAGNTVKEVREEAGLTVTARRVIAVQDRSRHNRPVHAYSICKIFVLCDLVGGTFQENSETTEIGYFSLEELPEVSEDKSTREQIQMCFAAAADESWVVQFD